MTSRDDVRSGQGIVGDIRCHVTRHTFVSNTPNVYWSVPEWHVGCAEWARTRAHGRRRGSGINSSFSLRLHRVTVCLYLSLSASLLLRTCACIILYMELESVWQSSGMREGSLATEKNVRHEDLQQLIGLSDIWRLKLYNRACGPWNAKMRPAQNVLIWAQKWLSCVGSCCISAYFSLKLDINANILNNFIHLER